MSDLSLLNNLFESYLMLCRSESIIKRRRIKFSKCVKRFVCVWVRVGNEGGKKDRRDWLKLEAKVRVLVFL